MPYSYTDLVASPGQESFTFDIPYLSRIHIHVYRGSGVEINEAAWLFTGAFTILLDAPAFGGEIIRIRRITPFAEVLVDYTNGSSLTAEQLDGTALQTLYVLQELADTQGVTLTLNNEEEWDFGGHTAINLGDVETIPQIAAYHNGIAATPNPGINFLDTPSLVWDIAAGPPDNLVIVQGIVQFPEVVTQIPVLTDLTATTITDNNSETTLATITIPAGVMSTSKRLSAETLLSYRNDSGSSRHMDIFIYFGGSLIAMCQFQYIETTTNIRPILVKATIQNLGVANSQLAWATANLMNGAAQTGGFETGALLGVNTANDADLVIKVQMHDADSTQIVTHRGTKVLVY